ncbi:MAG: BON domain-containing protein [Acidobacteriota bacterium]
MKNITWNAAAFALASVLAVGVPAATAAPDAATQMAAPASTDGALKDRIAYRLETSGVVRKYDLKVKVDQGVVALTGTVATAAQKAEAERIAKVEGVKSVTNSVEVDPVVDKTLGERLKGGMSKTGEKITDAWITTKVHWFFVGEDLLKHSDINVDTKDHVVTLSGKVMSRDGRERAVLLAKDTDGVKRVVDNVTVATP